MRAGALLVCGCVLLAGCRASEERAWSGCAGDPSCLDSLLRARLGFPPRRLDALADLAPLRDRLRADPPRDTTFSERVRAVASVLSGPEGIAAVTNPDDTDLVPSLAFQRHRGGCTSLSLAWRVLGADAGLRLEPVFLPGHMVLREHSTGRFVDPLRGCERTPAFYDSVFRLARRPAYAGFSANPRGLEGAMALQGGLLAWKSGRWQEALDALRISTLLAPGLPEAEGNLGLLFEDLGEHDSARAHLSVAVAGDSLNGPAAARLHRLGAPKQR